MSKRVSWVSVNSLSADPTNGWAPGYYYDGFVQAALLPDKLAVGGFWENLGGFQTGPRLQAGDAFLQLGVLREPMVYAGVTRVW